MPGPGGAAAAADDGRGTYDTFAAPPLLQADNATLVAPYDDRQARARRRARASTAWTPMVVVAATLCVVWFVGGVGQLSTSQRAADVVAQSHGDLISVTDGFGKPTTQPLRFPRPRPAPRPSPVPVPRPTISISATSNFHLRSKEDQRRSEEWLASNPVKGGPTWQPTRHPARLPTAPFHLSHPNPVYRKCKTADQCAPGNSTHPSGSKCVRGFCYDEHNCTYKRDVHDWRCANRTIAGCRDTVTAAAGITTGPIQDNYGGAAAPGAGRFRHPDWGCCFVWEDDNPYGYYYEHPSYSMEGSATANAPFAVRSTPLDVSAMKYCGAVTADGTVIPPSFLPDDDANANGTANGTNGTANATTASAAPPTAAPASPAHALAATVATDPNLMIAACERTTCVTTNECYSANGGCDQVCEDVAWHGHVQCSCHAGFLPRSSTGPEAKICDDVDECAEGEGGSVSHTCHANANCLNSEGSYSCECKRGYTDVGGQHGDEPGRACTLICEEGWTGSNCTVNVDECGLGKDTCDAKASCTNLASPTHWPEVYTNVSCQDWACAAGEDRAGNDLSSSTQATLALCQAECEADAQCKALTYAAESTTCVLKSAAGTGAASAGVTACVLTGAAAELEVFAAGSVATRRACGDKCAETANCTFYGWKAADKTCTAYADCTARRVADDAAAGTAVYSLGGVGSERDAVGYTCQCNAGYEGTGLDNECHKVECGAPAAVAHAMISYPQDAALSPSATGYNYFHHGQAVKTFEATAVVVCDSGWQIQAAGTQHQSLTCAASGNWERSPSSGAGPLPVCERLSCGPPPAAPADGRITLGNFNTPVRGVAPATSGRIVASAAAQDVHVVHARGDAAADSQVLAFVVMDAIAGGGACGVATPMATAELGDGTHAARVVLDLNASAPADLLLRVCHCDTGCGTYSKATFFDTGFNVTLVPHADAVTAVAPTSPVVASATEEQELTLTGVTGDDVDDSRVVVLVDGGALGLTPCRGAATNAASSVRAELDVDAGTAKVVLDVARKTTFKVCYCAAGCAEAALGARFLDTGFRITVFPSAATAVAPEVVAASSTAATLTLTGVAGNDATSSEMVSLVPVSDEAGCVLANVSAVDIDSGAATASVVVNPSTTTTFAVCYCDAPTAEEAGAAGAAAVAVWCSDGANFVDTGLRVTGTAAGSPVSAMAVDGEEVVLADTGTDSSGVTVTSGVGARTLTLTGATGDAAADSIVVGFIPSGPGVTCGAGALPEAALTAELDDGAATAAMVLDPSSTTTYLVCFCEAGCAAGTSFVDTNFRVTVAMDPLLAFGQKATYSCGPGYETLGAPTTSCGADGKWAHGAPECKATVCHTPTDPEHGSVTVPAGTLGYEAQAVFACDEGYVLRGSATLACGDFGLWSDSPPVCELVECPYPTAPDNGAFTWLRGEADRPELGAIVKTTCKDGFRLVGNTAHAGGSTRLGDVSDAVAALAGVNFTNATDASICMADGKFSAKPRCSDDWSCAASKDVGCKTTILSNETDGFTSGDILFNFPDESPGHFRHPSWRCCFVVDPENPHAYYFEHPTSRVGAQTAAFPKRGAALDVSKRHYCGAIRKGGEVEVPVSLTENVAQEQTLRSKECTASVERERR